MDDFKEKLRSINFGSKRRGQVEVKPVIADEGPLRGEVVGKTMTHWDGHVDATVTRPQAVSLRKEPTDG